MSPIFGLVDVPSGDGGGGGGVVAFAVEVVRIGRVTCTDAEAEGIDDGVSCATTTIGALDAVTVVGGGGVVCSTTDTASDAGGVSCALGLEKNHSAAAARTMAPTPTNANAIRDGERALPCIAGAATPACDVTSEAGTTACVFSGAETPVYPVAAGAVSDDWVVPEESIV
jgi:hypothetical protein